MLDSIILAGCLGLIVRVPTLPDPVDIIEVNHVIDANGNDTLVQLIFWDTRHGELDLLAWRLYTKPEHYPRRDPRTGLYVLTMRDKEGIRVIRAKGFTETWTESDPELAMRQKWPQDQRTGLSGVSP